MISHEARNVTVTEYAYLCARAARKFARPGVDRADLRQIAAIGLIKACDRYESGSQTPFEAFAWLFIVGELMHYVRDQERLIRPPRSLRYLERRAQSTGDRLAVELGREPTIEEVAGKLGVRAADVRELGSYREQAITQSIDALKPHQLRPLSYTIDGPEDRLVLQDALSRLSALERTIIYAVYGRGYSQLEIARKLGYSRRHISRLHRSALKKMQPVCVSAV